MSPVVSPWYTMQVNWLLRHYISSTQSACLSTSHWDPTHIQCTTQRTSLGPRPKTNPSTDHFQYCAWARVIYTGSDICARWGLGMRLIGIVSIPKHLWVHSETFLILFSIPLSHSQISLGSFSGLLLFPWKSLVSFPDIPCLIPELPWFPHCYHRLPIPSYMHKCKWHDTKPAALVYKARQFNWCSVTRCYKNGKAPKQNNNPLLLVNGHVTFIGVNCSEEWTMQATF